MRACPAPGWLRLHPQRHARVGFSASTFLPGAAGADRFRPSLAAGHPVRLCGGRLYAYRPSGRDAGYRPRLADLYQKICPTRRLVPGTLSDDYFQQGMAALRTPGDAINQNDAVTEEIDWFVFLRHG